MINIYLFTPTKWNKFTSIKPVSQQFRTGLLKCGAGKSRRARAHNNRWIFTVYDTGAEEIP